MHTWDKNVKKKEFYKKKLSSKDKYEKYPQIMITTNSDDKEIIQKEIAKLQLRVNKNEDEYPWISKSQIAQLALELGLKEVSKLKPDVIKSKLFKKTKKPQK